jgi:biofilm protein TabA
MRQGLEFLATTELASLADGRHDIDGGRLFALMHRYTTRPPQDCRWEAHRTYADIQYVIEGVERMGIVNITRTREHEPYDEARDVAFFAPGEDYVTVPAGMFAIFMPEDVHSPCVAAGEPAPVAKIVLKVAIGGD